MINKTSEIQTLDLLTKMMKGNDYSYDIYFRMAVIENYLNGNNKIWDIYDKLQLTRIRKIKVIPKNMIDHRNQFIYLINNFIDIGFNEEYPILINNEYLVIDGAHRMACALYFNIPKVYIITNDKFANYIPTEYTKQWFIDNELSECIPLADEQKKLVMRRLN